MENITSSGYALLNAYVALKAGDTKKAAKLFASLKEDEGFDKIMDGVAKGLNKIQAMEEEVEADEDMDLEDDDMDEDLGDEDLESEDDDMDFEDEEVEDEVEADAYVEIPASVVKFLDIK